MNKPILFTIVFCICFITKANAVIQQAIINSMTNNIIDCVKKSLPENIRILGRDCDVQQKTFIYDFPTCQINLGYKDVRYLGKSASAFILIAPGNALLHEDVLYDEFSIIIHDEMRWVVLWAPLKKVSDVWKEFENNFKNELMKLNITIYDDIENNVNSGEKLSTLNKKHVSVIPVTTTDTNAHELVLPEINVENATLSDVIMMLNMMIKEYTISPNVPIQIKCDEGVDSNKIIISLQMKNFTIKEILTYIINHTELLCRINNNVARLMDKNFYQKGRIKKE